MANAYTSLLRLVQQGALTNINQYGVLFNAGVTDLLEQAISGVTVVNLSVGDVTLTTRDGADDQARSSVLDLIGSPGTVPTVTLPEQQKLYVIANNTADQSNVQIKTPTSDPLVIVPGGVILAFVDGVTGTVRAFGGVGAIRQDVVWTQIPLSVDGGGFAVTARWTKIGDLVTVQIPAFTAVFVGTDMTLEPDESPAAIERPTLSLPAAFPLSVIDDSSLVAAYLQIGSGSWTAQILPAEPGSAFASDAARSFPSNVTATYAVTDD